MSENPTSCEVSRAMNEPLYGTIKPADVFFLLEYNGSYEKQAWAAAEIPQAVKDKLNDYPNGHPLLIRQPGKFAEHDHVLTLFIAHANTTTPQVYRLDLRSYEDILTFDIEAILRGEVISPEDDPLYVVCTNGKRDVCCSKWGMEVYNALVPLAGNQVWQSSHIGGHRLAATMYCFPHAICYGYLGAEDAPAIVESYSQERILVEKLRGRAIYSKPIQAAEYFLRRELGEDQITALRFVENSVEQGSRSIRFDSADQSYRVQVAEAEPLQALATTGDENYKGMPQYKFIGYKVL